VNASSGIFVISLDCELLWGVRDVVSPEEYRDNLLGARAVTPRLLDLFRDYGIHATWAFVGFLFFGSRTALLEGLPSVPPRYVNAALSPYGHIDSIGENEAEDPFHFAPSLIETVAAAPNQEVASHTFSHYYCLEQGQDAAAFRADLEAALAAARGMSLEIESLVLPRNQLAEEYLPICRELGIRAYRGNPGFWAYRPASRRRDRTPVRRAVRLADSYVNLAGHIDYGPDDLGTELPVDVPASRYLRPWSRALKPLEGMRLRRIQADLTHAAENRRLYHLWWHPHDFGAHPEENLAFLRHVLDHFANLRREHGMESLSMREVAGRRTAGA